MPLFQVQDDDRPMYVVAEDWQHAIKMWENVIKLENNGHTATPKGISFVCDDSGIICNETETCESKLLHFNDEQRLDRELRKIDLQTMADR